jgi:predicted RNase H-like HicB family nuclease
LGRVGKGKISSQGQLNKMNKFSCVLKYSNEDGGWIATIPEIPNLSAFGVTQEKAIQELKIARDLMLDMYMEDGCPIPEPDVLKPLRQPNQKGLF